MPIRAPKLLAITDRAERGGTSLETWLGRLAAAGVDAVQIREKDLSDRQIFELTAAARSAFSGLLLVNGRADIALAAGADGVHLPGDGVPAAALRERFGKKLVIGASTHDLAAVEAAVRAGVDYVTFGPVFPTPSKMRYGPPPGLSGLRDATSRGIPVLALGGIDPDRAAEAAAAGAAGVAGIRTFHDAAHLARWPAVRRTAWAKDRTGEKTTETPPDGDLAR